MTNTIEVVLEITDRKTGAGVVAGKTRVTAGGLPSCIAKAVREIYRNMDRKQRLDARKNGVSIIAKFIGAEVHRSSSKTYSVASRG